MARADVLNAFVAINAQKGSQALPLVKTPGGVWYQIFFSPIDNGLYVTYSSDGGFGWVSPALIKATGTNSIAALWYDKDTPSNTGTIIHIVYMDATSDDILYRPLDTAGGVVSLGTETTVFAGVSTGSLANTALSITRAIGGNLYVAFDMDGGTEVGFYRSTDAGGTWGARTDVNEPPGSDYYLLAPGFAADTNDIICIYWDRSASEISRKIYDDSANTWGETSIATSMTAIANSTSSPQFSITVDDANNKILLVAWSNRLTVNADLRFWTIDESGIVEGTNVVLNSSGNQQGCAICLATDTTTIYVFFGGASSGSDANIYYKTSTDAGSTWSAEVRLSNGDGAYPYLMTSMLITGEFAACFIYDGSGPDSFYISILIPSGGSAGGSPIMRSSVIT